MTLPPSAAGAPTDLLATARWLLASPDRRTSGLWPRAAALLTRQALEEALADLWRRWAPGTEQVSARTQLHCLAEYLNHPNLAGRVAYTSGALSGACHAHPYELSPTAEELEGWVEVVEQLRGFGR